MGNVLTNHRDVPFEICFKYKLQSGYTFKELQQRDVKAFQKFLDIVSNMSVQQVDETYARPPDKSDEYDKRQVLHYAVTNSFRIHVVMEGGYYKVIRLDPQHRFHNK